MIQADNANLRKMISRKSDPLIFVFLGYGQDAKNHRRNYLAGKAPDEVPYGFQHAQQIGYRLGYSRDKYESTAIQFTRRTIRKLLGFDLVHGWRNRSDLLAADVIWTASELEFLSAVFITKILNRKHPLVIGQTVFLFDHWHQLSTIKKWYLRHLLRKTDQITVHSERYLPIVQQELGDCPVSLMKFGISADSFPFRKGKARRHFPIRILSLGNDIKRDWTTLLDAFGNDGRFEVVIVSSKLKVTQNNVRTPRYPAMSEMLDLYEWADFVVVPMKENLYSGITVALEATAMGVPVISSDTGGIPTYFNATEVGYVPIGASEVLRDVVLNTPTEVIQTRLSNAQDRFVHENYTTRGLVARYLERCDLAAEPLRTFDAAR